jgi:hypothetical protein
MLLSMQVGLAVMAWHEGARWDDTIYVWFIRAALPRYMMDGKWDEIFQLPCHGHGFRVIILGGLCM